MKIIVTHLSVDLDAIGSAWLIKRFLPDWKDADLAFVPAGTTFQNKPADENPSILHVDTGLGKFDHHQTSDRALCAAKKVFDYLIEKKYVETSDREALSRVINFIVIDDNFLDVFWQDASSDIYDFELHRLIDGLKVIKARDDERCRVGFELLDAAFQVLKNKVQAESEIKKGYNFQSKWGKTLAIETKNADTVKLAMKLGFHLVIKKSIEGGYLTIKTLPKKELDLTPLYNKLREADPRASWYLHVSKNMLLNGSTKNPTMVPSKLPLKNVIEIVREIQ